jgi:Fe-S-cluster containining protein
LSNVNAEHGAIKACGAVITCASCKASCCRLEVMILGEDDVPPDLTKVDRWGGFVMARSGDGWCAALDRRTMRCGIYERRPTVCRDFQVGGSDCIAERLSASRS